MELINQIDETITFNKNAIRVLGSYNEPWFVAKDICEILELKDISNALLNISEKWKGTKVIRTPGGEQNMRIINEAGLYKLVMRSNKPLAKKFQEVVCEEILPSLRKKGEYKLQELIKEKEEQVSILQNQNKTLSRHVRRKIIDNNKEGKCLYIIYSTEIKDKVKIGSTTNIENRIRDLSCGNPERFIIKELYYTNCYVLLEESIKKVFAKHRISLSCEWYDTIVLEKIKEYIEGYIDHYNKFEEFSNFDDIQTSIPEISEVDEIFTKRICGNCNIKKDIKNDFYKTENGETFFKVCKPCYEKNNKIENTCKQCNNCYKIKFFHEFTIEASTKDGLSYFCKDCKSTIRKEKIEDKKENQNIGKKECKTCKTNHYLKSFFKDKNNTQLDDCITCYNEKNGKSKQCFTCNIIKSAVYFNKAMQNKDGLSGICKECYKIKRQKLQDNRKEEVENTVGKKMCIKCDKNLKYHVFFKKFSEDKETFEYYDKCRDCITPLSLQCNKCYEIKEINLFGIDLTKTTGHRTICKVCTNERDRKRREENKQKIK
jgi:prophage antirepressor-like protein